MRWKIGEAKQRFSEVVRRAATEPQLICNREKLVAVVIDAESANKLALARRGERGRSIAESFDAFRDLAKHERFSLKAPRRKDRRNPFADVLNTLSR